MWARPKTPGDVAGRLRLGIPHAGAKAIPQAGHGTNAQPCIGFRHSARQGDWGIRTWPPNRTPSAISLRRAFVRVANPNRALLRTIAGDLSSPSLGDRARHKPERTPSAEARRAFVPCEASVQSGADVPRHSPVWVVIAHRQRIPVDI